MRAHDDRVASALFGLAYFVSLTGIRALDVRNLDLGGDAFRHMVARNFAQWDAWHWPVTRIDNYMWPIGTSSVYTDANPWVTLVTKLVLPRTTPPIQLFGPWLSLCFALQGYFGARLVALATRDRVRRVLGGALFVIAPVLSFRVPHSALCAHWLILAAVYRVLRPSSDAADARRALVEAVAIGTIAAGVHVGIFALVFPLALLVAARHVRHAGGKGAVLAALVVLVPILVLLAFGVFDPKIDSGTWGFGYYSANLLTLFDPVLPSFSAFLPVQDHGPGQYEGMGYLGLGALALSTFAAAMTVRSWIRRSPVGDVWAVALLIVALGAAFYALSSKIAFGNRPVADLSRFYEHFTYLTSRFRSSGRFVWPLHYVLLTAGVLLAARTRWGRVVLAAALTLQMLDLRYVDRHDEFSHRAPSVDKQWDLARGWYRHLVLDPPGFDSEVFSCPGAEYASSGFAPYAMLATVEHLTVNAGWASRIAVLPTKQYCADVDKQRRDGPFDPASIYVPKYGRVAEYRKHPELVCGTIAGDDVCVRADGRNPFRDALVRR